MKSLLFTDIDYGPYRSKIELYDLIQYWKCIPVVEYAPQDWTETEPWMYDIDYVCNYNNSFKIYLETNAIYDIYRLSWLYSNKWDGIILDNPNEIYNKIIELQGFFNMI